LDGEEGGEQRVNAQQQNTDRVVDDFVKEMGQDCDRCDGDQGQEQEECQIAAQRVGARAVFKSVLR
jgi:hypothetical protein